MKSHYDHQQVESKWRKVWEGKNIYKAPELDEVKDKFYILPQLPYPSASGLHMGHTEVYAATDIYARFLRMRGKDVLQVIGWDSFGLPAENYAIKTNVHPSKSTEEAIDNYREQIMSLGVSLDWDREVASHHPDYYKWTQWFFKLMYERGLAYRELQTVNWCSVDKTVLANEQVENGKCERCGNDIELRQMEQWYLKITEYADRLLTDLDKVDWPEETVKRQRDWIGRSEGAQVKFKILASGEEQMTDLDVFTTRPDTLFGVTFMVIAPEHTALEELKTKITNYNEVETYVNKVKNKSELERQQSKEKSGVEVQGIKAVNPINGVEVPVFVSDYVLASYGTGAIMAVPAHDERDAEFADKFDIPKITVINAEKDILQNSGDFDGYSTQEAKSAIIDWLEKSGLGQKEITYKLHDWSISRQRFWGAPIPIISNPDLVREDWKENPDKVLTIHAFGSSGEGAYHPYVSESLSLLGVSEVKPELPGGTMPQFSEWEKQLAKSIEENLTENIVVNARSLGSWVALKMAEKYKMRKLILVCPTTPLELEYEPAIKAFSQEKQIFENLADFIEQATPDFEQVKENVGEFVVYLAMDDPYSPFKETEEYLREKLGNKLRVIRVREAGHFNEESGYEVFEALVEEILKPVNPGVRVLGVEDLPVVLPEDVDFKPTGQSPLTYSPDFQSGIEDKYGEGWKREVDTMDTFMCSSWYYFRYIDPHNDSAFASEEALRTWMPVDYYLGGPEHVNGHLLYSRFFTKVLFDAGYINFDEPFLIHRHQGMILGPDGKKMSKRKGNVVNPTDVVKEYGADTARLYLMFMGPLEQDKAWNDSSVAGVSKFVRRIMDMHQSYETFEESNSEARIHRLNKFVSDAVAEQRYNVAIAEFMKVMNEFEEKAPSQEEWQIFIKLIAPFAPFIAEEMWSSIGHNESVHTQVWPDFDTELLANVTVEIGVQFNGKTRGSIVIAPDASEEEVLKVAKQHDKLKTYFADQVVKKVIYVPGKILNIIVSHV